MSRPAEPGAAESGADDLNLNEEQQSVYDRLAESHAQERARLIEEQILVREELIGAFAEEPPDRATIRRLIDEYVSITHKLQAESAARFREFISTLTPQQRAAITNRLRAAHQSRSDRALPPHLRRFDLDGDGRLNAREAHRARAARREIGAEEWERRRNRGE